MHPRFVADITGDKKADLVGIGNSGVFVAIAKEDGNFARPKLVLRDFAHDQGWQVGNHPRMLADVNNDHRADLVGFGKAGVRVALAAEDGTFAAPKLVVRGFGMDQGWQVGLHPRFVADVTGDGLAEIVGMNHNGVYVSVARADGRYTRAVRVLDDFSIRQGWNTLMHPRGLHDLTGDGRADLVGFGNEGVYVAAGQADGTFAAKVLAVPDFGVQQGWQINSHPRFVTDVTGDGRLDIAGYGYSGVLVSVAQPDGTFGQTTLVYRGLAVEQGFQVSQHPRFITDVTGDQKADLVAFAGKNVVVATARGDGTFSPARKIVEYFTVAQGWQVGLHPRHVEDITGDGRGDLVGFGDDGVHVAVAREDGTFG
jgi:hypothetical protein